MSGGVGSTASSSAIQIAFTIPMYPGLTLPASVLPAAVATRVGSGNWTAATLQNGQMSINVPDGTQTYAFAYACPVITDSYTNSANQPGVSNNHFEYIYEQTVQDGASLTIPSQCTNGSNSYTVPPTTPVTLDVNAAAIPNAASLEVLSTLGIGDLNGNSASFDLQLTSGVSDFIVDARDNLGNLRAIHVLPSQTIPGSLNGGNPVVLTSANNTTTQPITYSNMPSGWTFQLPHYFFYYVADNNLYVLNLNLDSNGNPNNTYAALPTSEVTPGGYYSLYAYAYSPVSSTGSSGSAVVTGITTTSGGPLAINFPTPMAYSAPTPAALPTLNVSYGGFSSSLNLTYTSSVGYMYWAQSNSSNTGIQQTTYTISVQATSSSLDGATTLTIPNLSSVSGFLASPGSGATVTWSSEVEGQTYPFFLPSTPANGLWVSAENYGTYTVP